MSKSFHINFIFIVILFFSLFGLFNSVNAQNSQSFSICNTDNCASISSTDLVLSASSPDISSLEATLFIQHDEPENILSSNISNTQFFHLSIAESSQSNQEIDSVIIPTLSSIPYPVITTTSLNTLGIQSSFEDLNSNTSYLIKASLYDTEDEEIDPEDYLLTNPDPLIVRTKTATTQPTDEDSNCYITNILSDTNGIQNDSWWNRDARNIVTIRIEGTPGCVNQQIKVTIGRISNPWTLAGLDYEYDNSQHETLNNVRMGLNQHSESGGAFLEIELKAGDKGCNRLSQDTHCRYSMIIDTGNTKYTTQKNINLDNDSAFDPDITIEEELINRGYIILNGQINNNNWELLFNACDANEERGFWGSAFNSACDVPSAIHAIRPSQDEDGNFVTNFDDELQTVEEACLDENDEEIPNCYALLEPLPGIERIDGTTTIGEYLNIVIRFVIGLLGLFAVIMIVVGGIQYMSTDAISGKSEGRERITKALLGLILALGAFTILNTINPDLTIIDPSAGVDSLNFDIDKEGVIRSNQFIPDEEESRVGTTFELGDLSPAMEEIDEKIQSGKTIANINVEGNEGSTHGRAQIIFNDGSISESFDVSFGVNGISSNWVSDQEKTPTGQFTLGAERYNITEGNNQSVMSRSRPRSNLGAAFISVDQEVYVGVGLHGHYTGGLGTTYGCVRMTNADLLVIFDGIVPGESTITLTAN